jgi:hypothetical protein
MLETRMFAANLAQPLAKHRPEPSSAYGSASETRHLPGAEIVAGPKFGFADAGYIGRMDYRRDRERLGLTADEAARRIDGLRRVWTAGFIDLAQFVAMERNIRARVTRSRPGHKS